MQQDELVSCSGVLALELAADNQPQHLALERDDAQTLASFMADDLRKLLPGIEAGKLVVVGAHFDSSELLRPQFPTYAALDELGVRIDGEVVAFGTREGHMPAQPLNPDPSLAGGTLRLIPWTILLSPELAEALGPSMEVELVGRGEAGEQTADFIMRKMGVQLEHARYFSQHDIMALVCVHYEHVNLAPLWQLIEMALLDASKTEQVMTAHGLEWHYADHHAQPQTPGAWLRQQTSSAHTDLGHALGGIVFELRQYAALLAAHAIPLQVAAGAHYDEATGSIIETLDTSVPKGETRLYAHRASGLGVIALSVTREVDGRDVAIARAWPLAPQLPRLCEHLAQTYGCPTDPIHINALQFTDDGEFVYPNERVHG